MPFGRLSSTVEEERVRGHGESSRKSLHRAFTWDPAGIYRPKRREHGVGEFGRMDQWDDLVAPRAHVDAHAGRCPMGTLPSVVALYKTLLSWARGPAPNVRLFQRPRLLFARVPREQATRGHTVTAH